MSILLLHFLLSNTCFAAPIRSVGAITVWIEKKTLTMWPQKHPDNVVKDEDDEKVDWNPWLAKMTSRWVWRIEGGDFTLKWLFVNVVLFVCVYVVFGWLCFVLFIWFLVFIKCLEGRVDSNCISILCNALCYHIEMNRFTKQNRLIDWFWVFNATFSNISPISWRPVLLVEEAGVHGENHRPWASNW